MVVDAVGGGQSFPGALQRAAAETGGKGRLRVWRCLQVVQSLLEAHHLDTTLRIWAYQQVRVWTMEALHQGLGSIDMHA